MKQSKRDGYKEKIITILDKHGPLKFAVIRRTIQDLEPASWDCPPSGVIMWILRENDNIEQMEDGSWRLIK